MNYYNVIIKQAIDDKAWDSGHVTGDRLKTILSQYQTDMKGLVDEKSHVWHEKYSLPYTTVLGYVACHVTSKFCGIGPAERSCCVAVKTVTSIGCI